MKEMWTNISQVEVRIAELENGKWVDNFKPLPIEYIVADDVFKVRLSDGSLMYNDNGTYLFKAISDANYCELRKWWIEYE